MPIEGDRFLTAVEATYAAAVLPSRWPDALQAIAECFDDVGCLLIYQRDDGGYGTIVSPQLEAAQREYVEREWWRHDIRFQRYLERSYLVSLGFDTVTERHLATPEEFESHPFYTEFLAAHGLKWFAGTPLSPDPHVAVALAVQRAATKPPYTDEELGLVNRLARHVENALRLGIRLIDTEAANVALSDALARVGVGVFLVDAVGRVLFSNAAARRLLGHELNIVGERLTAQFAPERDALKSAIAAAAEGSGRTPGNLPRPVLLRGDSAAMALYVLPIQGDPNQPIARMMAGVRAIVIVTTFRVGEPPDPAVVRDLLGLTLGEARVATLVGSGLAPREAAAQLGVTEETTRTTLKRVFSKLGVSRQSELAMLLTRLVPR
jgi:DNA-binding CsgD family transcriptional regulator/PAS domain-containing protein